VTNIIFTVPEHKAKNLYDIQNNGTSIDNFIIGLKKEFGDMFTAIGVKGITAGKNEFYFKDLPYRFEQKALYWESEHDNDLHIREYYLKLYVDCDILPLRICNMDWVPSADSKFKAGKESDFLYNRNIAFEAIEDYFKKHTKYFLVSVFCGVLPNSSWMFRSYIKVIIKLPVRGIDLFLQTTQNNLTDFGKSFYEEIKEEFIQIVDSGNYNIIDLFTNKKKREIVSRNAENILRKKMGLKKVGDANVNETLLANLTKKIFPDAIRQYSPSWLGRYVLDIYVPSLRLAIEYHGLQHYQPIDFFGGEEKFKKQQERDNLVRNKCKEFNVTLLEWHYETPVSEKNVYDLYSKIFDLSNYKRPLTLFD
jgi:hypothetical protein